MNKIIVSAFTVLLMFSGMNIAQAAEEKADKIEEVKQQILQAVDKQVAQANQIRDRETAIIGQFRLCIQNIKSEADFNNCDAAKNESFKKMAIELEKARLESQKKAIANQEKRLNEESKSKK
jgi:hypothetical protein